MTPGQTARWEGGNAEKFLLSFSNDDVEFRPFQLLAITQGFFKVHPQIVPGDTLG